MGNMVTLVTGSGLVVTGMFSHLRVLGGVREGYTSGVAVNNRFGGNNEFISDTGGDVTLYQPNRQESVVHCTYGFFTIGNNIMVLG